jgi:hypothetical protein
VETLMKANKSWDRFYRSMQRALPKQNSNLELNLTDKEGEPLSNRSKQKAPDDAGALN